MNKTEAIKLIKKQLSEIKELENATRFSEKHP